MRMLKFNQGSVLFAVFVFAFNTIAKSEYFYPIANIKGDFFLAMYQKSTVDLEVWICDAKQNTGYKELSAFFFPSCVQLLPDQSGFSFIDRGKIRIKYFDKRAVHTMPIPETIFRVVYMHWIDKNSFYMTAQETEFFKTYFCLLQESDIKVTCLQAEYSAHFFYPTIINNVLFCMQKTANDVFLIVKKSLLDTEKSSFDVLCSSTLPICDLQVNHDGTKCYFVSLITKDPNHELLTFECFLLECCTNQVKKLFDFCLPRDIITGFQPDRLFESFTPFAPYQTKNGIYFSHAKSYCSLCFYDFKTDQTSEIFVQHNQKNQMHFFAPLFFKKNYICGLGVCSQELVDPSSGHCCFGKVKNIDEFDVS